MRQNPDRQDTGQARRTEWRVRPARPSDRAFILGITPRLAQGFELPAWRTAREVVEAESATLENALRPEPSARFFWSPKTPKATSSPTTSGRDRCTSD
jgi:hypothetical protein